MTKPNLNSLVDTLTVEDKAIFQELVILMLASQRNRQRRMLLLRDVAETLQEAEWLWEAMRARPNRKFVIEISLVNGRVSAKTVTAPL